MLLLHVTDFQSQTYSTVELISELVSCNRPKVIAVDTAAA